MKYSTILLLISIFFVSTLYAGHSSKNRLILLDHIEQKRSSISFTISVNYQTSNEKLLIYKNNRLHKADSGQNPVVVIFENNLKPGKHSYLLKLIDNNKKCIDTLLVSGWVSKEKFSWGDAFIYQIMTDRFVNGDKTNDLPTPDVPFKSNWQGGDFRGIINKLEEGYFEKLGVNTLWISSPISNTYGSGKGREDDYNYSAYHSYWPTATGYNYQNNLGIENPIDTHFGTSTVLKKLIEVAHSKNIKVITDFVANHIHLDSTLYQQQQGTDWFHELFVCGWKKPISCWFTDYLPDLNYSNPKVLNQVIDHAIWLIQEFNFDGFRLDAVKHMDMNFTKTIRKKINEKIITNNLPFYLVGETFTNDFDFEVLGKYLGPDKLDGQFDFPLFYHISRTFFLGRENFRTLYNFLKVNDSRYPKDYFNEALMSNFLGNHDIVRAISVANSDFYPSQSELGGEIGKERAWTNSPINPRVLLPYKKLRMAQTFIFTSPGIPMIYQGDEFGMAGAHDPDNRRMMLFNGDLNEFQVETMKHLSKLGKIRNNHPALRFGKRTERWINEDVFIYSMEYLSDTIIVAFNRNNYIHRAEVYVKPLGMLNGTLTDLLTGKTFKIINGTVNIVQLPMNSMLLEFKPF